MKQKKDGNEEKKDDHKDKLEKSKSRTLLVPEITHERIAKDLELIKKLTNHFDEMRNITTSVLLGKYSSLQPTVQSPENSKEEKNVEGTNPPESFLQLQHKIQSYSQKQQLDLFIYYLAKVHFHSFYSCSTFPAHEKEKVQDVYRSTETINEGSDPVEATGWVENFEKKIETILTLDLQVASGERRADELLEIFYTDKIIKDNPDRFRCELCNKMFKGPVYVKKHISTKHPEKIEEIKEKAREEQFYRNYVTHSDKLIENQAKAERERNDKKPKIDREKDLREKKAETRRKSPPRNNSKSPQRSEKRQRSPNRESGSIDKNVDLRTRERSPAHEKFDNDDRDRRNNNWRGRGGGHYEGGWRGRNRGRYGKVFDSNEPFDIPPDMKDKMDPRANNKFVFKDLDKPQEDSFEIDYEKALAAFATGEGDS